MSSKDSQSDPVRQPHTVERRKGSRRVVMTSRVDRERIEAGEFATAEEALHAYDAPEHTGHTHMDEGQQLSARDKEILADVPPHFGKL